MNGRMPTIFFGHGNPMNALLRNRYTEGWRVIGSRIRKPKAILSISAHWYVPGVALTGAAPRTIHDFGGFPRQLFEYDYPAPGAPQLATRVQELLAPEGLEVPVDESWGLDHGTWAVLCHVFPAADVPVVQLSIDETQPASFHYALGQRLRPLRDEGILLMGSGDIVHNLHAYAWGGHPAQPYDWALRFEARARELMLEGDHAPLVDYESLGEDAVGAHARTLSAAALRARRSRQGRASDLSRGRHRRGLGVNAGRAVRIAYRSRGDSGRERPLSTMRENRGFALAREPNSAALSSERAGAARYRDERQHVPDALIVR